MIIVGFIIVVVMFNIILFGFKIFVIEKRISEVWEFLLVVKIEFLRFVEIFEKVKKKFFEV